MNAEQHAHLAALLESYRQALQELNGAPTWEFSWLTGKVDEAKQALFDYVEAILKRAEGA